MQTMRAIAVRPEKKELALIQTYAPELASPTDVKLRMLEVGVCGTDKEICAFEYGIPPQGSDTLVIGHESLAEVAAVGPAVKGLQPGDLVVPMVRRPCPHDHCPACRAGRQDFCFTGDFVERGIKGMNGFMTEYVVDDARYMVPVPRALREVAVLVEPLTIAEKALIQLQELQERLPWNCQLEHKQGWGHCHTAVVLGAGPVGLLGAMALRAAGFETFVYSREAEASPKGDLVRSFGARYVSAADHDVEKLGRRVGRIDLVYEAVGSAPLAFETMKFLGANGAFIFTGVPPLHGRAAADADLIMRNLVLRNQLVLGTVNAGRDAFLAAIRDLGVFLEQWPQAVKALITGRFPIEKYKELLQGAPEGIKNLISLNGQN